MRVKERSWEARSLEYETSSSVRIANSKPELSQLLFISIRQRKLIRVPTSLVYLLIHATTSLCMLFPHLYVTCDMTRDMTCDVTLLLLMSHCVTQLSHIINRK